MHGSGYIDDEDILTGRDLAFFYFFGRLHHEKEKVFILSFKKKKAGLNLIAGKPIFQNKISVAALVFRRIKGNGRKGRTFVVGSGFV